METNKCTIVIALLISYNFINVCGALQDADLNIETIVTKRGYSFERHFVETKDGYILQLHRIQTGRHNITQTKPKPPILLVVGLIEMSIDMILQSPESIVLILADRGYDTWLLNVRGTTPSLKHRTLSISSTKYWDFSFHESGIYDLPVTINYILTKTNQTNLFYVGYSQGGLIYFILTSMQPEYNKKIRLMVGISPASYVGYISGASEILAFFLGKLFTVMVNKTGPFGVLGSSAVFQIIINTFCKGNIVLQYFCVSAINLFTGFTYKKTDVQHIASILSHYPAGCSIKTLIHYAQQIYDPDHLRLYDYGSAKNMDVYNSSKPPEYNISQSTAPVVLFYGNNDWLVTRKSIEKLKSQLPNVVEEHYIPSWNHFAFLLRLDNKQKVFYPILRLFENYS